MSTQEHFSYEGNITISKKDPVSVEVKGVVFLTPAKVDVIEDGVEKTYMVSVDIINRKIYMGQEESCLSKPVFDHLDSINILPDDFFAAPEGVANEAGQAQRDYDEIREKALGTQI